MSATKTVEVTPTGPDQIRNVIYDFNADSFDSLYPKYKGGRHAARAPGDQEGRQVQTGRVRPALLDLECRQAGRLLGRRGVGRRHQPRGPSGPVPRRGRLLSTREDLEDLPRPRLRHQEGPRRTPLRDHRRRGHTRGRRTRSRLLPRRVRPSQPPAPPRPAMGRTPRQGQGPQPRPAAATCHLHSAHDARHLFAAYDLAKDKLYGHIKRP